jgi:hypothetical protein
MLEPYPFTQEEWQALPPRIRDYIHHLETRCDPAGDLRAVFALKAQRDELLAENELLRQAGLSETPFPASGAP